MKRNITSFLILATLFIAGLSSCEEQVAEINENINLGNPAKLPTVTISDASNVTFDGAVLSATIASTAETDSIIEAGFILANNEGFMPTSSVVFFKSVNNGAISSVLTGLTDKTTFYVKAYAVTYRNGTAYSSTYISFTTPEAPTFEDTYLFGIYDAIDIDVNTGQQEGEPYPVEIRQIGTLYNRVSISNIWGGEETIQATVDFTAKTITTDSKPVIYVHPDYGDCWMRGFDIVDGSIVYYASSLDLSYAIADYDNAGHVNFRYWAARVSAGTFGYYVTQLTKR
jgi:hypothetical protein